MLTALMSAAAIASTSAPRAAPAAFVSQQYGLTFRTPPESFYCALGKDWAGSDHGTVIFLAPPARCGGAGFPSSARGWRGSPPRIEVFYGYDLVDDDDKSIPASCDRVGWIAFLGGRAPLCRKTARGRIEVSVAAKYQADEPVAAVVTLVTSRGRLVGDLGVFKVLLRSARTCSTVWRGGAGKPSFTTGSGPPCPQSASWF